MIVIKIIIIITGTKIVSHKSSLYYDQYKSSSKNEAKCSFRLSLQRSAPVVSLSSEYFSNSFLSVKVLTGQFC